MTDGAIDVSFLSISHVVDIDECTEGTSGCEQVCANTNGGFGCSCFPGYSPKSDNKTCTMGTSQRSLLLVVRFVHVPKLHRMCCVNKRYLYSC